MTHGRGAFQNQICKMLQEVYCQKSRRVYSMSKVMGKRECVCMCVYNQKTNILIMCKGNPKHKTSLCSAAAEQ